MRSHALVLHVFASATHVCRPDDPGRRYLQQWWEACARLGMDAPVPGLGVDTAFPGTFPAQSRFRLLAAREQPETAGPGVLQAMMYRTRDAVIATVLIAADPDEPWSALEARWLSAFPDSFAALVPSVLGTCRVYRALAEPPLDDAGCALLIPSLRQAVPGSRVGLWTPEPFRTADGLLVSDGPTGPLPDAHQEEPATSTDADGRHRRLVVLAEEDRESVLDAWTWSQGPPGVAPLTRYLWNAAALRHQDGVYRSDLSLRTLRADVTRAAESLTSDGRVLDGQVPLDRLRGLAAELTGLRTASGGVIAALTRVRVMRRSIAAAEGNMAAALGAVVPVGVPPRPRAVLPADQQVAGWLAEALDDEAVYLAAAADQAEAVSRLVDTAVQARLSEHQQQLTQLQTSVLGALVMAFTAAQTLDYRLPVTPALRAPVICLLAALALCLPGAVLRWSRATSDLPLRGFDFAAVTALGTTAGWTLAAGLGRLHPFATNHPWHELLAATAGGLIALTAGRKAARPAPAGPPSAGP